MSAVLDNPGWARQALRKIPGAVRPYVLSVLSYLAVLDLSGFVLYYFGPKPLAFIAIFFLVVMFWSAWLGYLPGLLLFALTVFVMPLVLLPEKPQPVNWGSWILLVVIQLVLSRMGQSKRKTETSLEQTTSELERHEDRLREQAHLLDLASDAILTKDDDRIIRFWSRGAAQMYGWTEPEAMGKSAQDLLEPEFPEPLADIQAKLLSTGAWQGEVTHKKRDGSRVTVMSRWALRRDAKGAPCGSLEINTDITARRKVEEQLRHSQKMESIGLLAGGVAHDFNNLLTVINGYSEMILADLPPDSPMREEMTEIRGAGERAANLTHQLLAFGRKQMVQTTVLNLNSVVTDVQKMLGRLIGENIEMVMRLAPDLANVVADAGQIQQIIVNLVVNARDAMPGGGTLMIETANMVFDESYAGTHPEVQPGPFAMLAVTDTGTGIPPDIQDRLFEPFFTTKPKGAGTGLGLSTVYGMVKQTGGWIWVYSEPGRGATFKVYLPQTVSSPSVLQPVAKSDLHGTESILIVEDQADVRGLAVTALKRYGYTVRGASSGGEALTMIGDIADVKLLVTDVVMPGMSGGELARQLLQIRPQLRVIFTSGYTEGAVLDQETALVHAGFLQKPFTPERLAEKVRDVLGPQGATATVLVVEEDETSQRMIRTILTDAGFAVVEARSSRQAQDLLMRGRFDVVVTDDELKDEFNAQHPQLKHVTLLQPIDSDRFLTAVRNCMS